MCKVVIGAHESDQSMIDTHLHILPGVDDGPDSLQESLMLAQELVRSGVHSAIATPHYNDMYPQRSAAEIRERVWDLQQALDRHSISLRLFAGHEVLIKAGLLEDIQAGRVATLNGSRYLLLELWSSSWLPETEWVIFELLSAGIVPVIAHPERYRVIQQDQLRLIALLQQGVLAQLMAGSLIGKQGKSARSTAEILLKKGLIHCIASDSHGLRKRPPVIIESLQYAAKLLDSARIYQLIETWPGAILKNEDIV